jgi:predicted dehydrogenase
LERIKAYVGPPPLPYDLPEEPIPADLDWDLWLGPNPYVHFNHALNPPTPSNPFENDTVWAAWRYYKETSGGFTTNWGSHMFDIAQWAMKMDHSGPSRIIPAGYQDYDYMTFEYANGVVMSERPWDEKLTKGVKFWGSDGWIEITRGVFNVSDESLKPKEEPGENVSHYVDFINSVRSRKDPIATVEIGHRTCTTCMLGNIAHELKRPVRWDPAKEQFISDSEATKHLHREYREGYRLIS